MAGALAAPPVANASVPAVSVLVVGRGGQVLAGPRTVHPGAVSVRVGRRTCHVGAATPLAALAALRVPFGLRDYGSCGRRAADAGSLFVTSLRGQANRGRDGWVYKVGRRVGSSGAGDLAGPFGTGHRLANGTRLLWFWCQTTSRGGCERTLEISAPHSARAGSALGVTVRAYDDNGRGVPAGGATVELAGGGGAVVDRGGHATLRVPAVARGRVTISATQGGRVPAFPVGVPIR